MKWNIKSSLVLISALSVTAMSCLKDKAFDDGEIQSVHTTGAQKIIEISLSPYNTTNYLSRAYPLSDVDTTINLIPVTLASAATASEDIHVKLNLSQELLDQYNNDNGTEFVVPDPSMFTLVNTDTVVTIPKGSNVGYLKITFHSSAFLGGSYAFPFVIGSIDKSDYIESANLNSGIASIGPKNKYDGLYSLVIKTTGWAAFGIADGTTDTWPSSNGKSIGLITSGANSVEMFDYVAFNTKIQVAFTSDGSPTGFGATTPQFTFDPDTDALIDVKNTTPDDGRGRALQLNTDVTDSRYDASTGTIYAAYIMTQNGRPPQYIYDTLTYKGSR